jgi:hypothetical protein
MAGNTSRELSITERVELEFHEREAERAAHIAKWFELMGNIFDVLFTDKDKALLSRISEKAGREVSIGELAALAVVVEIYGSNEQTKSVDEQQQADSIRLSPAG